MEETTSSTDMLEAYIQSLSVFVRGITAEILSSLGFGANRLILNSTQSKYEMSETENVTFFRKKAPVFSVELDKPEVETEILLHDEEVYTEFYLLLYFYVYTIYLRLYILC